MGFGLKTHTIYQIYANISPQKLFCVKFQIYGIEILVIP